MISVDIFKQKVLTRSSRYFSASSLIFLYGRLNRHYSLHRRGSILDRCIRNSLVTIPSTRPQQKEISRAIKTATKWIWILIFISIKAENTGIFTFPSVFRLRGQFGKWGIYCYSWKVINTVTMNKWRNKIWVESSTCVHNPQTYTMWF
jgi:hypothetical protein